MSAGVLQFSIGLTAGGFLGVLDRVNNKVGDFSRTMLSLPGLGVALGGTIASVSSLHAVVEGVFGAIERGAALEHLSKRTQTAVGDLFTMQKGFTAVGLSADDVGPTIFRLQKSLGGVNEYGEDTKSVFHSMGLSVDDLRKKKAPEQLLAVANALRRMNVESAAKAAGTIFGREGAANMIQLANSTTDYATALKSAAHDAELFERNAESFAKLERGLNKIKSKTQTLFAGMAEGAAPGIQLLEDKLNQIDLTKFGEQIGNEISMAIKAIDLGDFEKYLTLVLQSSAQEFSNTIMKSIAETYSHPPNGSTPLSRLQAGAAGVAQGLFGIWDSIGGLVNSGLNDRAVKMFQAAQDNFDYAGIGDGIAVKLADAIISGMNGMPNTYAEPLKAFRENLKKEVDSDRNDAAIQKLLKDWFDPSAWNFLNDKAQGKKIPGSPSLEHFKPEGNAFEKMSFVMGGYSNPFRETNDLLRAVVNNTSKLRGLNLSAVSPMTNQL